MFWVHLAICLRPASPSPSPPSLLPELVAKSEKEKRERERERLSHLGVFLFPSPHDFRRCLTSRSPCHGGSPPPPSRFWSSWSPIGNQLLPRNPDAGAPAWISPHPDESEPKPPQGYVVSFVRLHERGFGVPVSKFMRALCEYYGVELHNFRPHSEGRPGRCAREPPTVLPVGRGRGGAGDAGRDKGRGLGAPIPRGG